MHWTVLATTLTLLMYLVLGALVSKARGTYRITAPATTGNDAFERVYRVHQNTTEQLILFLPSLWMFAAYVSDLWAGILGVVFVIGRVLYARSYYADAAKRTTGFMIGIVATLILLLGAAIGVFAQV